jgi:imidazolonepropionase-like amidohydrolase
VGSIEAGKFADLIAVEGNQLEDVTVLERVRFVMKGGQVVRSELVHSSLHSKELFKPNRGQMHR